MCAEKKKTFGPYMCLVANVKPTSINLGACSVYLTGFQGRISYIFMNLDFVIILCWEDQKPKQTINIFAQIA